VHLFAGEITQKQETDFHENLKNTDSIWTGEELIKFW